MNGHGIFRYLAIVAFVACYVTVLLGGNVMASDSGLACPDWPTCHGSLLPPLSGATGVEWSHRLSAFVLSLLTVALAVVGLIYEGSRPVLRRLSLAAALTVFAQALLGGLVVESSLSVAIVLLHFALATVLFGLLLILALLANYRSIPAKWADWARKAGEESPTSSARRPAGPETGRSSPAKPARTPTPPSQAG